MFDKRFDNQNVLSTDKDSLSGKCYWCSDAKGLENCKVCDRNFCKFCIKKTEADDIDMFVCFICSCFEATKVVSQRSSYLDDRELMHMLRRYESLCSDRKLSSSVGEVFEDIASMNVVHLPQLVEVLRGNIYSMLSDIDKLSTLVAAANEENGLELAQDTLLLLLKVVTKHHLFNRLGRPSHCLEYQTQSTRDTVVSAILSDPIEKCLANFDDTRAENSPSFVDDDERITPVFILVEEEDIIPTNMHEKSTDDSSKELVKYVPPETSTKEDVKCVSTEELGMEVVKYVPTKKGTTRKSRKRARDRSLDDVSARKMVIASNDEEKSNSPIGWRTRRATTVVTDGETIKSVTEAVPTTTVDVSQRRIINSQTANNSLPDTKKKAIESPRVSQGLPNKMIKLDDVGLAMSSPPLLDVKKERSVCTPAKKNPHHVAPVVTSQERSFVIKEATDVLAPPVKKMWSWERHSSKIVIPFKNRLSAVTVEHAKTDFVIESLPLEQCHSTEILAIEPLKKRGRPRKYFSDCNLDLSQNSQDEQ